MNGHPVRWQAPQPLWSRLGPSIAPEQARPALLRFATDEFMDQMLATLARDPSRIDALMARPETWREPAAASADLIERTPLPRLARMGMRAASASKLKPAVPPITPTPQKPLKLYQPAHQRHYLVSASLVCAQQGLPERAVAAGGAEQVNFVLRRLLPAAANTEGPLQEYAFIKDAHGARWQRIGADGERAVAGEETLPLFPLAFNDDLGHARRLWSGSVPVGRREEYMGTAIDRSVAAGFALGQQQSLQPPAGPAPTAKLARVTQFQLEVAEPWKTQIRSAYAATASLLETSEADGGPESPAAKTRRAYDFNLQQQNVSWLILLDLADYIASHLPDLWTVIDNNGLGATGLPPLRRSLHDWLAATSMPAGLRTGLQRPGTATDVKPPQSTLRGALKAIRAAGVREKLERTELSYIDATRNDANWPPFHFTLAGIASPAFTPDGPFLNLGTLPGADSAQVEPDPFAGAVPGDAQAREVDRLTSLIGRALSDTGDELAPPIPFALQLKNALAGAPGDPGWFVIRFAYTRRDCGPLHPPVLSAATERFQLANFFDSDAPARPIRITLPLDTSPAGLRKFNKNTAFVISDMLCGQMQRAKGLGLVDLVRSVLPWPLHKDLDLGSGGSCKTSGGINIGMICSLSIPIITICALILLIVIVFLLDFVFRWLPYFVLCFPVPGLKGKKG